MPLPVAEQESIAPLIATSPAPAPADCAAQAVTRRRWVPELAVQCPTAHCPLATRRRRGASASKGEVRLRVELDETGRIDERDASSAAVDRLALMMRRAPPLNPGAADRHNTMVNLCVLWLCKVSPSFWIVADHLGNQNYIRNNNAGINSYEIDDAISSDRDPARRMRAGACGRLDNINIGSHATTQDDGQRYRRRRLCRTKRNGRDPHRHAVDRHTSVGTGHSSHPARGAGRSERWRRRS